MKLLKSILVYLLHFGRVSKPAAETDDAESFLVAMRARFQERLEVGLPLSIEEYVALGNDEFGKGLRAMYKELYLLMEAKRMAMIGRYVADAFATGALSDQTAGSDLDEYTQDILTLDRLRMMRKIEAAL